MILSKDRCCGNGTLDLTKLDMFQSFHVSEHTVAYQDHSCFIVTDKE